MTTIYLIRHAEAEGNLYRRIHGDYDSLVTDNGYVQIEALRRRFSDVPVDAIWSSDRFRTMETARAIFEPKGLPLHTDPDLREIDMGLWEDRPWGEKGYLEHDALARFNGLDPDWHAPGGETRLHVEERMMRAMRRIVDSCPGGTVAVVSHGMAIGHFTAAARGLSPEQWQGNFIHADNTAVSCLAWDGTRYTLIYEGDNSHLSRECSTLAGQHWWRTDSGQRDVNLWYRPLDFKREKDIYFTAYRGTFPGDVSEETMTGEAVRLLEQSPWAITAAMEEGQAVGVVAMDAGEARQGIGMLRLCCMLPQFCGRALGVQLIGQAVSYFRPMGVDRLRLACAEDSRAAGFFRRYGFARVGGSPVMEKYVGYGRKTGS